MNTELLSQVADYIEKYPESFDMNQWGHVSDCGAVACIAGTALHLVNDPVWTDFVRKPNLVQMLFGTTSTPELVASTAQMLLDLTEEQATRLFFSDTSDSVWTEYAEHYGLELDEDYDDIVREVPSSAAVALLRDIVAGNIDL